MKNSKGFTLIELVVVLAILSIIFLIASITINTVLSNQKGKIKESAKKMILDNAPIYFDLYTGTADCNQILISTLISNGTISSKAMNPETGKRYVDEYSGNQFIYYDSTNSKYEFCFNDTDSACNDPKIVCQP